MTYRIEYGPHIDWKRFRKVPKSDRESILSMIERKLFREPAVFGKPLHSPLHALWSLRIGDYRIIYRIMGDIVRIELIGHRSTIYPEAEELM